MTMIKAIAPWILSGSLGAGVAWAFLTFRSQPSSETAGARQFVRSVNPPGSVSFVPLNRGPAVPAAAAQEPGADPLLQLLDEAQPSLEELWRERILEESRRGIELRMHELTGSLGLSAQQAERVRAGILASADQAAAALSISDPSTHPAATAEERSQAHRAILEDHVSAEQLARYDQQLMAGRARRVEQQATVELRSLQRALELDDAQQDQVFAILVRHARAYDASMAPQRADGTPLDADGLPDDRDAAIRTVLRSGQRARFDEAQARRQNFAPANR